jgi:hypothetical protein
MRLEDHLALIYDDVSDAFGFVKPEQAERWAGEDPRSRSQ